MDALSLSKIRAYHRLGEAAQIPYVWGAKPDWDLAPGAITGSDCSGWVRYLCYHGSSPDARLQLPQGSEEIFERLFEYSLRRPAYSDAALMADASRLFVCGWVAGHAGQGAGHIWLLNAGRTLECHGGLGVDSRIWNARIDWGRTSLAECVQYVFEAPTV